MQRLTVYERLLVVALLPALALLARDSFGPGGAGSLWTLVCIAISATSVGLALFVGRSLALPIRRAADALEPLAGGVAQQQDARSEIARLCAVVHALPEAAIERARREADQDKLDDAERGARHANLSNMADQVEDATERGLRTVLDGSAVLRTKTDDMREALEAVHAASSETAKAADHSRAMNE